MRPDLLDEADAAAAQAAGAAGVVIRELDSLAELVAMVTLFDEVWEPEDGNPSIQARPAARADQGGQLRVRRLRPGQR